MILKSPNLQQWHHLNASFEFFFFFCQLVCHQVATLDTTPPSLPGTRTPQRPMVPPPLCTLPCRRPPSLILKHLSHTSRWGEKSCHWVGCWLSVASSVKVYLALLPRLATCWSGSGPPEPVPGCHEPPVQHPRGSESGQPVAGEEPAATDHRPCPNAMSPTGPPEGQLQPRVSHCPLLGHVLAHRRGLNIFTYNSPLSLQSFS